MLDTHLSELAQFMRLHYMSNDQLDSIRKLAKYTDVSFGTARRLISLTPDQAPKEETLRKIAYAFDLPVTAVREMAHRPSGELVPFDLPPEANQLSMPDRDLVLGVVHRLLAARAGQRVAS